jgi:AmiR/NasT family two-component response regulator
MSEQTKAAKILIIEDEALIAREIQHRLTNMGWEVVGMAFGREAIELAIETQPDLLLSDINLRHGLSGIDLALEIQEVVDVPVVFLTAYSDEETVARAKTVTPFGYIIKPVENRDLQITIEMALYKFRVEKELREKQQLLETALACIGSALVFVDDAGTVTNLNADAEEMLKAEFVPHTDWQTILSLESNDSVTPIIDNAFREKVVVKIPPFLMQRATDTTKLVDGIVGPMDAGAVLILRDLGDIDDPVEMLSAPDELISMRGEEHLSPSESAFCQLLISPENVSPQHLSAVVEEVRSLLDASLRATDLASVFAESMVSVSLPYTDINEGERIAEALLAQLAGFTFEREQISFSAGLAYSTAGDQEPIELFRRATTALDLARKSGGNRLWVLAEDKELGSSEIQGSHEYRHVILLWNTMNALANADDLASMCDQFCRHLFLAFHARCVALLGRSNGNLEVEIAYLEESGRTDSISDLHLTAAEFTALGSVLTGGSSSREVDGSIMVNVTDRWVLLMSGDSVETEDVQFLETLATYFAGSVSRFDVIEEPEPEVNLPQRALIYESREMQEVLDTADLAAPTDATVLLTGESGTGKELVAHYIHEHGGRKEKPLIVVDCGAVSPSLIESELFGHVKGAFTGATSNFAGRLKEANGATVLLDEI